MNDLREIYQETILDHGRHPRNFRQPEHSNRTARGYNPFCGDRIDLYVQLENEAILDIGFEGGACAICMASASMMTQMVKGKPAAEANALAERFRGMLTSAAPGIDTAEKKVDDAFEKLKVFEGVRDLPIRIKCAILPWHALLAALRGGDTTTISTE